MEDNVFAKIIRRELPAEIIYEDEHTLAFLDQMPDSPGHTLVVPKSYAKNIFDVDAESFARVMETARKLSMVVRKTTGADGIRISINNEPAGGQKVFYLHVHVIPYTDAHPAHFADKVKAAPEELSAVAIKIREALG